MFHVLNNVHKSSSRTTSYASVASALNAGHIYGPRVAGRSLKADRFFFFFFWVTNFNCGSTWKGLLVILTWTFIPENNNTSASWIFLSPHRIKRLAWMENTQKGLMDGAVLSSFQFFFKSPFQSFYIFLLTTDIFLISDNSFSCLPFLSVATTTQLKQWFTLGF